VSLRNRALRIAKKGGDIAVKEGADTVEKAETGVNIPTGRRGEECGENK